MADKFIGLIDEGEVSEAKTSSNGKPYWLVSLYSNSPFDYHKERFSKITFSNEETNELLNNVNSNVEIIYQEVQQKLGKYNSIISIKILNKQLSGGNTTMTKQSSTNSNTNSSVNSTTNNSTSNNETLVIEGTAFWAKVHELVLNERAKRMETSIQVSIDSATEAKLRALNVPIKNKDADLKAKGQPLQGTFVSAFSKFVMPVTDSQGNALKPTTLIGNGSKVRVEVLPYTYDKFTKEQTGVGLYLQGTQVIELVPYKKESKLTPTQGYVEAQDSE